MNINLIRKDIEYWIMEDIPQWDNSSINILSEQVKAIIISKQEGMISGVNVAREILNMHDIKVISSVSDGNIVSKGDILISMVGLSNNILQAERTCLNIFSHMSGISNFTHELICKIDNPDLRLAATRKTLPGLRRYQKWAVHVGGGDTHRMSLSSMIMLKENHLSTFNSITDAVKHYKNNSSFSLKIEVEVRNNNQAIEAVKAGVDILMLDNYSPEDIKEIIPTLKEINNNILIEASGNIDEKTILSYSKSGVNIISMGKLTHSSNVFDMSLLFDNID